MTTKELEHFLQTQNIWDKHNYSFGYYQYKNLETLEKEIIQRGAKETQAKKVVKERLSKTYEDVAGASLPQFDHSKQSGIEGAEELSVEEKL